MCSEKKERKCILCGAIITEGIRRWMCDACKYQKNLKRKKQQYALYKTNINWNEKPEKSISRIINKPSNSVEDRYAYNGKAKCLNYNDDDIKCVMCFEQELYSQKTCLNTPWEAIEKNVRKAREKNRKRYSRNASKKKC